jgi:hypothetical protein
MTARNDQIKALECEIREQANEILRKTTGDSIGHCNTATIFSAGDKKLGFSEALI